MSAVGITEVKQVQDNKKGSLLQSNSAQKTQEVPKNVDLSIIDFINKTKKVNYQSFHFRIYKMNTFTMDFHKSGAN